MASERRSFVNFSDFGGTIHTDTDTYQFPKLFLTDSAGHLREWTIYVRLIKQASAQAFKCSNWSTALEDQVPLKPHYLADNTTLPRGLLAQVWTETGIVGGTITRSAPTYPKEKNVGRANYRDTFKQALILARGKYLKKRDEGGRPEASGVHALDRKYLPMLAKRYEKPLCEWPVYVQPKLDGMRCIAYLDADNVVLYTRRKKEYPTNKGNDAIRGALLPLLRQFPEVYLDGELYIHGMKLQMINHCARATQTADQSVQFWIYDMFIPSLPQPFCERAQWLDAKIAETETVRRTDTRFVRNQIELDLQYSQYLTDGYEGMMIRAPAGLYSVGVRSKDLLKRKEVFTDEFEVVGWTQGTGGKEIGAVIWICQTSYGRRFHVTPNMEYEERYAIYQECLAHFQELFANRMMTIEYRSVSADGIPQHAKGIAFRDE